MHPLPLSPGHIKQLYGTRSNWRGAGVVLRDVGLLGLSFGLAAHYGHTIVGAIALIWGIGCVQFAMGESLLHEASHGNLFRTPWLNRVVGNLLGFCIFTTLEEWKTEHAIHHRHLLSPQDHLSRDYQQYRLYDHLHPVITWIAQPLLGVTGWQWAKRELPGVVRHWGVFWFYGAIALGCWLTHTLDLLVLYWLVPLIWAYSSILYWSEITDHYLAKSATRTNTSPLWNVLFHNGGYHWLHHQYPFIPWYQLKAADAAITPADTDRVNGWWAMYGVMLNDYYRQTLHQTLGQARNGSGLPQQEKSARHEEGKD